MAWISVSQHMLRFQGNYGKSEYNGKVNSITMGWYNNHRASVFYRDRLAPVNQFKVQFRLQIDSNSCTYYRWTSCAWRIFGWCASKRHHSRTDRCGADGAAFILSTTPWLGGSGGCLGYCGLHNVMAVEFDTYYNGNFNDPYHGIHSDRHVSVILKRGVADANERNAVAYNNYPVNFNDNRVGGYTHPWVVIQYSDYNLEIFMNNRLAVAHYSGLNIPQFFGTDLFYYGFSSGTGTLRERVIIRDLGWMVGVPHNGKSYVYLGDKRTYMPKEHFDVYARMRTNCDQDYYITNTEVDNIGHLSHEAPSVCQLVHKVIHNSNLYRLRFYCTASGTHQISVLHRGGRLNLKASVKVQNGPMSSALVEFVGGNKKSIDHPIQFYVVPKDRYGNEATIDVNTIKKTVSIEWPNKADSQTNYQVTKSGGKYLFTVYSTKLGRYSIKCQNFGGKVYYFDFTHGKLSKETTEAIITDPSLKKLPNELVAGTEAIGTLIPKDKGANIIPLKSLSHKPELKVYLDGEKQGIIKASESGGKIIWKEKFTRAGVYNMKSLHKSDNLKCIDCSFEVKAAKAQLDKAAIFSWNQNNKAFVDTNNQLSLSKDDFFQFVHVIRDQFLNIIEEGNKAVDYKISLSGNQMNPISLCLSDEKNLGVKLVVCEKDLFYYNRLASKPGYVISVENKNLKVNAKYNLTITSDGSFNDCGNGDLDLVKTQTYWVVHPNSGYWGYAGKTYTLAVKLITKEGMRHCAFIPNDTISYDLRGGYTRDPFADFISEAKKDAKLGVYLIDMNFKKASRSFRMIFFKLEKSKFRIPQYRRLMIKHSAGFKAKILSTFIQEKNVLKSGIVKETLPFQVGVFDVYNNPAQAAGNNLNILAQHQKYEKISVKPVCSFVSLGLYYCSIVAEKWGTYALQNEYFKNFIAEKEYLVSFYRTEPSNKVSTGKILNDMTKPTPAGSIVKFRIVPKDSAGDPFVKVETDKIFQHFGLSVKSVGFDSTSSTIAIQASHVNEIGNIVVETTLTKATQYVFTATYKGLPILCEVCAISISPADAHIPSTKLFQLISAGNKPIDLKATLVLNNAKNLPVFTAEFYDEFANHIPVVTSLDLSKATLNVPNGAKSQYEFLSWNSLGKLRFRLSSELQKFYQEELANDKCSLNFEFKGSKTTNKGQLSISSVVLQGKEEDKFYTNDDISLDKIVLNPSSITIKANEKATIQVELRADNGRLFNHPDTHGWYTDASKSIRLIHDDIKSEDVSVINGKKKGTYIVTFTSKVAKLGTQIGVSYSDPKSNSFQNAASKVKLNVKPANYDYLVIKKESLSDCEAGNVKEVSAITYDPYNNMIPKVAPKLIGLDAQHERNVNDLDESIKTPDNGLAVLAFKCTKAGRVNVNAPKFKEQAQYASRRIKNYQIIVRPGPPESSKSLATVSQQKIKAGESVQWRVYPYDSYDNMITVDEAFKTKFIDKFTGTILKAGSDKPENLESFKISADKMYIYVELSIEKAGEHVFQSFYENKLIASAANKVHVSPLDADFTKCKLSKLDDENQKFILYNEKFYQDIASFPTFKVSLYDKYANKVKEVPKGWKLGLELTGKELEGTQEITFCVDSKSPLIFSMCSDPKLQKRYKDLITNRDYDLNILNSKQVNGAFKMNLSGDKTDPDASNLPVDVNNTVITPKSTLETTAGISISFNLEIRTSNKNLRRNEWYSNPSNQIKVSFSKKESLSSISHNVKLGDKKGRYVVEVTSSKTFPKDSPCEITVAVEGKEVPYKPTLIVNPAAVEKVLITDEKKKANVNKLPSQSIDSPYIAYFHALDKFGNAIHLGGEKTLELKVVGPKGGQAFVFSYLNNGVMRVQFQPKVPGEFKYDFLNDNDYSVTLTQGSISDKLSYGTVLQTESGKITAGDLASVVFYPIDKWGNSLDLNNEYIKKAQLSLMMKSPEDNDYSKMSINGQTAEDKKSFEFKQAVTIKGENRFAILMGDTKVKMRKAAIICVPGEFDFLNSKLFYFDEDSSSYLKWLKNIPISEDNVQDDPIYLFRPRDKYGNEYDEYPEELKGKFSAVLYGHDYSKDKPVNFVAERIQGNGLLIVLDKKDETRYRNGLFKEQPYTFEVVYNNSKSLYYQVKLLGRGEGDKDAEIEKPIDIAKTFINPSKLSFTAGSTAEFTIEIRTASNKRKADINPSFKFTFEDSHSSNKADVSPADKRGRFLVTITGTKATMGFKSLSFTIDSKVCGKKVSYNIVHGNVHSINVISELNVGSADSNYMFVVLPLDKYGNTVYNAKEENVNLQVKFPKQSSVKGKSYYVWNNGKKGTLFYFVKSRVAGEYTIKSSMLESEKKFTVKAGVPSSETSIVNVSPSTLKAGEKVSVSIEAYDKYSNRIHMTDQNLEKTFNFDVAHLKDSAMSEDAKKDTLEGSFSLTRAGSYSVVVQLGGKNLACKSCVVKFNPAEPDLDKTKMYVEGTKVIWVEKKPKNWASSVFKWVKKTFTGKVDKEKKVITEMKEISKLSVNKGTSDLSLRAKIYDTYENRISSFDKETQFSLEVGGNNMVKMVLQTTITGDLLAFSVKKEDQKDFSRLVPATNYELNLVHSNSKGSVDNRIYLMDILGNADGAGNGPLDTNKTYLENGQVNLIAGKQLSLSIELKQSEGKRYNGECSKGFLVASEGESVGNEKLQVLLDNGEKNCQYILKLYGTKALAINEYKKIEFKADGKKLNATVLVHVDPDKPDPSKTLLAEQLPKNAKTDELLPVLVKLRDKFENLIDSEEYASSVTAEAISGNLKYNSTTMKGGAYSVNIVPLYPPRFLEFKLYMTLAKNQKVLAYSKSLSILVDTTLDPNKTEASPITQTVEEKLRFTVKLNDVKGYCFETNGSVTVTISGPYASGDEGETKVAKGAAKLKSKTYKAVSVIPKLKNGVSRDEYSCHKYYEVNVLAEDFVKAGYYDTKVTHEDVNLKTIRNIHLLPGAVDPDNTLISLHKKPAKLAKDTEEEMRVYAGDELKLKVQLQDKYRNALTKSSDEKIEIKFSSHEGDKQLTKEVKDNENGSFFIDLAFLKAGEVSGTKLIVQGKSLLWTNLEKSNFPNFITVSPLKCSNEVNGIDTSIFKDGINVGEKVHFKINCFDKYGNTAIPDKYKFVIAFKIDNIKDVGTSEVKAHVVPKDEVSNVYDAGIRLTYPGVYLVNAALDGEEYAIFNATVKAGKCPLSAPTYCVNTGKCVEGGYKSCGFPEMENCSADKPFKCKVFGDDSCVKHKHECDCENAADIKCMTDNKCVPADKEPVLCSTFFWKDCPEGTTKCQDGISCRKDNEACPSYPGCPPGHKICPDQTCLPKAQKCPSFEACPPEKWYKCEDQSCVANPIECPTRIACGSDSIVCPDKTCANSEVQCRLPAQCPNMYTCPDLSCRPSKADCPKKVTCPFNLGLCQDNVCRESCKGVTTMRLLQGRILAEQESGCKKDQFSCPGGECVTSQASCPTLPTCPVGSITCPDGSCGAALSECPARTCKAGLALCWDGSCYSSKSQCPTRSSCPESLSVKCPDGSCVASITECREVTPCPQSQSHRCANGECRRKADECPTLVTCPAIFPIKCSDNSCAKTVEDCLKASKAGNLCLDNEIICPDGSCAASKEFCATIVSCPVGFVKCYDGNCAENLEKCNQVNELKQCPSDKAFKCGDGQCRANPHDCPTGIICPLERPILCSDGNCRESASQCSTAGECPENQMKCSDGSCNADNCPSAITCPLASPYKCSDGTCKKDPRDCTANALCPSNLPVKCGDGSCVKERRKCPAVAACEALKPVRCPDNNCVASASECSISSACPQGTFRCHDGSCRKDPFTCEAKECSGSTPVKCPSGECVSASKYCQTPDGCPFYLPYKCENGACVKESNSCTKLDQKNIKGFVCPDGAIAPKKGFCSTKNGCPSDLPQRCNNGICVDGKKKKCEVPHCPEENPVKCLDGTCVSSSHFCPSYIPNEQFGQCKDFREIGLFVPCGDGSCAFSSEGCPPLAKCPYEFYRCGDGSCRPDKENCPIVGNTCPGDKFRCENGACVSDKESCITSNGCPKNKPVKCANNGICAGNEDECSKIDKMASLSNGCPLSKPFKCKEGTCVASKNQCNKKKSCPDGEFLCPDNSCDKSKKACLKKKVGCAKGEVLCPDNSCKKDFISCSTTKGCPVTKPFKCEDECSSTPCPRKIRCPPHKPFLCADGECQSLFELCKTVLPCQNGIRCPDNSCASSLMKCPALVKCPLTNPIECDDGSCVGNAAECKRIKSLRCPVEKPLRCLAGNCATSPYECIGDLASKKSPSNSTEEKEKEKTRILATSSIDPGCDSSNPHRCSDGSCKSQVTQCSLLSACSIFKPFRCENGQCAGTSKECEDIAKSLSKCDTGLHRCEDGICRKECPAFYGCSLGYVQCADGTCAKSTDECTKNGKCFDKSRPVRCSNGECVTKIESCALSYKYYVPDNIKITVNPLTSTDISFIQGGRGSSQNGKIVISAGLFGMNQGILEIQPVPDSQFANSIVKVNNNEKAKNYFHDFNGELRFRQAQRSPLVKIATSEKMQKSLILALSSDILAGSNKETDYALFEYSDNQWKASSYPVALANLEEHKLAFQVKKPGVYGVFYNPNDKKVNVEINQSQLNENCDYYCQNKGLIITLIVLGILSFIILISALLLVFRYKKKLSISERMTKDYKSQVDDTPSVEIKEASQNSALYETMREKDAQIMRLKEREEVLEGELEYYKRQLNVGSNESV